VSGGNTSLNPFISSSAFFSIILAAPRGALPKGANLLVFSHAFISLFRNVSGYVTISAATETVWSLICGINSLKKFGGTIMSASTMLT